MEEKIPVANEMSTSQRPAIEVLQKLGYKYISAEENKKLRNYILTDVIFKAILAKNEFSGIVVMPLPKSTNDKL